MVNKAIPFGADHPTHASAHFTWAELGAKEAGPVFRQRLARLCREVLEPIRAHFGRPVIITSGWRSFVKQEYLWNEAIKKYGSAAIAALWVAKPGSSLHEIGTAVDIRIMGIPARVVGDFAATLPTVGAAVDYPEGFLHVDQRKRGARGALRHW